MISFTENAEDHLKKTIVEGEIVRVAVLGGGCSGMSYAINVEDTPSDEEDLEIVIGHVKIYIDPHSAVILNHTIVDYVINLKTLPFEY